MERYSQFWISTANNSGKVSFESNCLVASGSSSSSWEEEAFAEDAAGRFGGLIWPPRSYRCNFCGREFKSAQALGGHMNIHRKEKARINNNHDHDHDQDHKKHNKIRFNPQDYIRSSTEPKKENEGIILASGFGSSSSSIRVFGILGDKRTTEKDQKERNNMAGCKRRRIDEESQYISNIESSRSWAPTKILKGAIDDLDLELRLGDPPKVK